MNNIEVFVYFIVFIGCQLYALFSFYRAAHEHVGSLLLDFADDFEVNCRTPWLPWTCNQPRDITDDEWQVAKKYYFTWKVACFAGHSLGFAILRKLSPKNLPYFIVIYTLICLYAILGLTAVLLITVNIFTSTFLLSHLSTLLPSYLPRHLVHYTFFACSVFLNNMYHADAENFEVNLLVNLSISWLNARCLSAAVDSESVKYDLKTRLAYLLYFPSFFFGPIYHFSDFANSLSKLETQSDQPYRLLQVFRYFFWALILEFILKHYLYSSAYLNFPHQLALFPTWALAGFGFSLMLLFFLKYLVLYGVGKSLAELDGLQGVFASPPQCIAHMNKTSYLWRKFDQGLYAFLFKYFYSPLTGAERPSAARRVGGSAVCFAMIAVWHEQMESLSILVWVLVNFALLSAEVVGAQVRRSDWFRGVENCLSASTRARLQALLGSPYLAFAYLSNILFLSTTETVSVLTRRLFAGPSQTLALLAVLYAGCHVCTRINGQLKVSRSDRIASQRIEA